MTALAKVLVPVLFWGGSLLQLEAVGGAVTDGLGLHWIFAGPIALVTTFVPLLGSGLAVYGAVVSFHWPVWAAMLLAAPGFLALPFVLLARD